MSRARGGLRTWTRAAPGDWRPLGVYRRSCGCWWDSYGNRMWEPCHAHEAEGHLSVITTTDSGISVARCLVGECGWTESWARDTWAVDAARGHWAGTRS